MDVPSRKSQTTEREWKEKYGMDVSIDKLVLKKMHQTSESGIVTRNKERKIVAGQEHLLPHLDMVTKGRELPVYFKFS